MGELMAEVVDKYGVVWVASAGNNGPALCTISTPPDISVPNIIGQSLPCFRKGIFRIYLFIFKLKF
jgi:hypothetical protein